MDKNDLAERIFPESKIFEEKGRKRTETQALKVIVETDEGEREAFLVGTRNLPQERKHWEILLDVAKKDDPERVLSVQFSDGLRELVPAKDINFLEEEKKK